MHHVTPKEVDYPPHILKARKNLQLTLHDREKQILIGSILGDAYIYTQGKIQFEQSDKQKEYLFWKFDELKNLAYGRPSAVERIDKRTHRTYRNYRFWLRQYFRQWRQIFYDGKKKVFPERLHLTPLSIAIWYMDDGCYSNKNCILSTDSFSNESLRRIQSVLYTRFHVDTLIRPSKKLVIRAKDHEHFFDIIRPYVHKSMCYKIV